MLIHLTAPRLRKFLLACIAALSFIFMLAPLQAHASSYRQGIMYRNIKVTKTWDADVTPEPVDITMRYPVEKFPLYYKGSITENIFPEEIPFYFGDDACGTATKQSEGYSSEFQVYYAEYSVTLEIPFHFSSYDAETKSETITLDTRDFACSVGDISLNDDNFYTENGYQLDDNIFFGVYSDYKQIGLYAMGNNSTFAESSESGTEYDLSVTHSITEATHGDPDVIQFTLTNRAKPKGTLDLTAQKTVNNKTPDQRYTFYLLGADGTILQTKRNDLSDGSITFDSIEYDADDIGTEHTYYVKELAGTDEWTDYDSSVYTVKVTPSLQSDDASVIVVDPIITKDGEEVSAITFNNTVDEEQSMEATGSNATESDATESDATEDNEPATPSDTDDPGDSDGSVISKIKKAVGALLLTALKTVNNGIPDQSYTFCLLDADGNTLQTKQNASSGTIQFSPISYHAGDIGREYTYQVKEQAGSDPTITYDSSVYTVTVNPYLDPDDASVVIADPTITKDGNEVSEILFNNTVDIARGNSGSSGGGSSSSGSSGHSSQSSDSGNPSQSVDSAGLPQSNNPAEMLQSAGPAKLPKTGEPANPVVWIVVLAAAAAALIIGLRERNLK